MDRGSNVCRSFEPFRQAAAQNDSAGVGVGLALVARFAELQGGRAWLEDGERLRVVPRVAPGTLTPSAAATGCAT